MNNFSLSSSVAEKLFPFQIEGLEHGLQAPENFCYLNWDTGTGKSHAAIALIQELLIHQKLADVVFLYTFKLNKINFGNSIEEHTGLKVCVVDGSKASRRKKYQDASIDVYVLNYEKNYYDLEELKERIKDKNVIFILDEVQRILLPNKSHHAFRQLRNSVSKSQSCWTWSMSASSSNGDPLRTHRLYSFLKNSPLGTQKEFREKYVLETRFVDYGKGRRSYIDVWDIERLKEIPELVAPWTHTVRKNDPDIKKFFKDTDFIIERVQLSDDDREVYSIIESLAQVNSGTLSRVQLFNALRYCCNTMEAFNHSDNELAQFIRSQGFYFDSSTSNKFHQIIDKIEQIRDQGDKVVVFTQWTNLSLLPFSRLLSKFKINHVVHYGSGMTALQAQQAQNSFKKDSSITVFLSSDAGSHALSFQEARYVIHIEPPHSYDLLTQRSDRIDRIDSYLDGLTSYLYLCDRTVEERIWQINNNRRILTGTMQGTQEVISRPPVDSIEAGLRDHPQWLLTGK